MRGVVGLYGLIDAPVAGNIHLPAAVEPEHALHEPRHVIAVRLRHIARAVDDGAHGGYLPSGALYGYAEGLFRPLKERGVEFVQRDEARVQLRDVFNAEFYAEEIHGKRLLISVESIIP